MGIITNVATVAKFFLLFTSFAIVFVSSQHHHYHQKLRNFNKNLQDESILQKIEGVVPEVTPQMFSYDISNWTRQSHLQECAIVEIGEGFCALFLELRSGPGNGGYNAFRKNEFFLGLCNCVFLHEWRLCSPEVAELRPDDCTFQEGTAAATTDARVHRRLCDVTKMVSWNKPCNCSDTLADKPIYRVTGFPTCFQPPLPDSLCAPRGVCGVAHCEGRTVFHQIQSVLCDPNCVGQQPFCERLGPLTTAPRSITSAWSEWSAPKCNATCGQGSIITEATCIDKESGKMARDCIGPGVYCCSPESAECECQVHYDDDGLKVTRILADCEPLPPCLGEEYVSKEDTGEVSTYHPSRVWMENGSEQEDEGQHLKQVAELPLGKFEVRAHLRSLLQVKSEDGLKKVRAIGHNMGETIYDYKDLEQSEAIIRDNVLSMRVGNGDDIEKDILKELVDQPYDEIKLQKKSSGISLFTRKPSFVCIIMGTVSTIKNINK